MVRRLALGSPYSKPSTAEDGLPHPAIPTNRFAGIHAVSMQRWDSVLKHAWLCNAAHRDFRNYPAVGGGLIRRWLLGCSARAPFQYGNRATRHSAGDSSVRSALLAATTMEARIFQRNREGASDKLPESRIPGSRILRKTGSRTGRRWHKHLQWVGVFQPGLRRKVTRRKLQLSLRIKQATCAC
jgi:hypothetical protein